ncbi:hypothetical protein T08_4503 [Trichinella sp. T8]|nr:hypothetical protein T08_4503 [Trichinella sp. T8]
MVYFAIIFNCPYKSICKVTYLPNCLKEMSVTGILQWHNRTPK